MNTQNRNQSEHLEELYPGHSPEWYAEAQDNLDAYLSLIIRIYDRISVDPELHARLQAEIREGMPKCNVADEDGPNPQ